MSCETNTVFKHKHHIVPRYLGGSNDSSNIIEVTITQHSMWHFCNYQLWGNWEDYLAHKALSGQIKGQDIIKFKLDRGSKKGGEMFSKRMKEKEFKEKIIQNLKNKWEEPEYKEKILNHLERVRPLAIEAAKTPEARKNRMEAMKRNNHQKGEKNPQYGTRWVYNLELKISKRIKKEENLPKGWQEGRVIDFDKKLNRPVKMLKTKEEKNLGLKRNWRHDEHGVVLDCTSTELAKKFKNMNLDRGALSQVALGRNKQHKGWRIMCNSEGEVPKIKRSKSKSHLWHNKELGVTLNLTAKELVERFLNHKLRLSSLYRVTGGKSKSYKGWTIVK